MRTECTFLYSNMHQLDPPYLQSQWPGWTHCRDWRTDSWPQLCGHPLHGWAWRCGSTTCPSCARIYKSTSVERQFELNNNFCLSWVIIVCFVLKLLTSWVSGRRHRSKQWLVEQVPGNILHHGSVAGEDSLSIHNLSLLGDCADVPQADSL